MIYGQTRVALYPWEKAHTHCSTLQIVREQHKWLVCKTYMLIPLCRRVTDWSEGEVNDDLLV